MSGIIKGWTQIIRFFNPEIAQTDKLPVEDWSEWTERKGWELAAQGMPVFFMPELDEQPRASKCELLRWARGRSEIYAEGIMQAVNMETARKAVEAWREEGNQLSAE